MLASGSQDQSIRLWDLTRNDYPGAVLRGHDKGVTSVAFVPPGSNLLVSAGLDGTIKLWDVLTRRCTKTLPAHSGPVACLAVSPEGKTLASGGIDGTVRLWDLAGGKVLRTLSGHRDKVSSICFSPNGKLLASASWDRTIRTWEMASGQPRVLEGHEGPVSCLQFSPDGNLLASGSHDQTVRVWYANTGQEWATFRGPAARINALAWNREPLRLVAGLSDNTMAVWRTVTRVLETR